MTQTLVSETEHLTIEMDVTSDQKSAILNFFQAMNFPVQVQEDEENNESVETKAKILAGLKEAITEINLHRQGKLELPTLRNKEETRRYLHDLLD